MCSTTSPTTSSAGLADTNTGKLTEGAIKTLKLLNLRVLEQCKTLLAECTIETYDKLDIKAIVANVKPDLWESICLLTRSISDNRSTSSQSEGNIHLKMVRRLFLLCCITYCTDDRCALPMHTIIADLIDSQGGSEYLIQVLNLLGICVSVDSLSRHIQTQLYSPEGLHPCKNIFDSEKFTDRSVTQLLAITYY